MYGEIVFWIPRSAHRRIYDAAANYIHSIGADPIFQEMRAADHVIEFVAQGFGISLVPGSAVRLARSEVVFKPLADGYLRIETTLIVRKDKRTEPLQSFIDDLLFQLRALKLDIQ
ncbi:MAG: LysR substrate-binding domain-containing protein [Acidobacteriaceae bacterium]